MSGIAECPSWHESLRLSRSDPPFVKIRGDWSPGLGDFPQMAQRGRTASGSAGGAWLRHELGVAPAPGSWVPSHGTRGGGLRGPRRRALSGPCAGGRLPRRPALLPAAATSSPAWLGGTVPGPDWTGCCHRTNETELVFLWICLLSASLWSRFPLQAGPQVAALWPCGAL